MVLKSVDVIFNLKKINFRASHEMKQFFLANIYFSRNSQINLSLFFSE